MMLLLMMIGSISLLINSHDRLFCLCHNFGVSVNYSNVLVMFIHDTDEGINNYPDWAYYPDEAERAISRDIYHHVFSTNIILGLN